MARKASPERDAARALFLESRGKMTPREIAEKIGVDAARVRKWKSEGKWQTDIDKMNRKRGAPIGNKNAAFAGAPFGNKNAETHGAFSTVRFDSLPDEVKAYIEGITGDPFSNMLHELQLLRAKEYDLQNKIHALESGDASALYVDKVVEMLVPKSKDDREENSGAETDGEERLKTAMKTIIKASPFDRAMKLEAELNRTHGRIIKLLDSIKAYEMECRRASLEERKYRLAKQRLQGAYEIDPETGEIDDTKDVDDDENDDA